MDRLFLDACVLFSTAFNPASPLKKLWDLDGVTLLGSDLVVEEARRNLAALRAERVDDLERLSGKLEIVTGTLTKVPAGAERLPDKDLPVLLAALAGRATHLVTVDKKHFGFLFGRKIGGAKITTPSEYLKRRG